MKNEPPYKVTEEYCLFWCSDKREWWIDQYDGSYPGPHTDILQVFGGAIVHSSRRFEITMDKSFTFYKENMHLGDEVEWHCFVNGSNHVVTGKLTNIMRAQNGLASLVFETEVSINELRNPASMPT